MLFTLHFNVHAQLPPEMAMPVEAAKPVKQDVAKVVNATGTLFSEKQITVSTEVPGRVVALPFKEGEKVNKGDILLKIDDSLLQAELNKAKAALALSQLQYDRTKTLLAKGTGTASETDQALAKLKIDEATVAQSQAQLEKTTIRAPFDGYVGIRKVDEGEYVTQGQDIVSLQNMDTLKVQFRIPEIMLAKLQPNQEIELSIDAFPEKKFMGKVTAIDPKVDVAGRSVLLQAEIANENKMLRPGLYVNVSLILERHKDALLVPEQAVQFNGNQPYVFVVVDKKAAPKNVTLGIHTNGMIEIPTGITPDDKIITAGHVRLFPGVGVMVTNEQKAPSAPQTK